MVLNVYNREENPQIHRSSFYNTNQQTNNREFRKDPHMNRLPILDKDPKAIQ